MELIHVFDALQVLAAMSDLHLPFQLDGTHLGEVYRSHEIFIIVQFFILFIKTGLYHFISNTLRFCSRISNCYQMQKENPHWRKYNTID